MTRLPDEQPLPKKLLPKPTRDSLPMGACVINFAENRVLAVNDQLRQWIGDQSQTIAIGQVLALLPELDVAKSALPGKAIENNPSIFPRQMVLERSASPSNQAMVHLSPMETGQQTWHLLLIQPCEQPSQPVSYTDAVTRLPDRRVLEDWRQRWQHKNPGEPNPHALLFLDLDEFKQINDKHGHACGDRILAILAERWKKSLRGEDLVVRYGGDEFVILLAGIQSTAAAMPVIERLKACTIAPIQVEQNSFSMAVSIGLALADDVKVPLENLLEIADRDMYAQKGIVRRLGKQ